MVKVMVSFGAVKSKVGDDPVTYGKVGDDQSYCKVTEKLLQSYWKVTEKLLKSYWKVTAKLLKSYCKVTDK